MGKPIIGSDFEQIKDLLSPALKPNQIFSDTIANHVGILVPPNQPDEFIRAACTLMHLDKVSVQRLGENARNKAINNFTWEQHVKRIEKTIKF